MIVKQGTTMKFRKKPVVIEAVQWNGRAFGDDMPAWLSAAIDIPSLNHPPGRVFRMANNLHISTLEGEMTASPGDWIIRGVKGELYPCKPDIFEATYEPA
jgi:hypothetical protein